MVDEKVVEELFDKIVLRLGQYAKEKRASTQWQKLADQLEANPDYQYDPEDELIREALNEHIGFLPILATTIYPYLGETEVDLGEALVMLAIHDIGETIVGDQITFGKDEAAQKREREAALKILHTSYHDLYERAENPNDPTACFAKSMDKLIGDYIDYLCPADITLKRYQAQMGLATGEEIIKLKRDHKADKMTWNPLINQLFEYGLDRIGQKLSLLR